MMRSLYSGVTGLRNHQTRMDVIGNNIANVNTVGYKASRVIFQDIYSQTLRPASGPSGADSGGTNPLQIGLGMTLATIDVLHTRSAAQYTGAPLDLSIEGDGYFGVSNGGKVNFTRAGNFYTDVDNNLVNSNGYFVQGFEVNTDGTLVLDVGGDPILTNINIDPDYYDVTINKNGGIVGLEKATNAKHVLGQMVLTSFVNQSGLEKVGQNMYRNTVNSGDPIYSVPGSGGTGQLNPGTLEMSNVDLANEFTDMIVTQRGFQANSRIITTTDQMLEELVNLKR
ncbi:MAG: flagellar hook-basal body complex protein [Clostridiales bacterium]|nr:flagellar hook-basal body complex protein [Clostridiales bacterium]